jgi:DNA (cytosine-5)-methyltransferase 1
MLKIESSDKKKLSKYKFIDLFAGIGGFHYALSSYGAKCVFASEWDIHASSVYENNFGLKPHGDITKVDEKQIPSHNILCGGFPCQAFSIAGKQKGFDDTRGTLFFDILRIAKYHNPEILFLENVKNLAKHEDGRTISVILKKLDEIGYNVFYKILNTSNFGLPQNRERVYFVCFRKDLKINKFDFPTPIKQHISLNTLLEEFVQDEYYIYRDDIIFTKSIHINKDIFGESALINKPLQIGYVNKGGQGERIYHTEGHAITLSAYGGGAGAKTGIYLHNNKIRKLMPRECARAQGFPEEFIIHPNKNQAYKQFGNSVSINVLQSILKEIANKTFIV